MGPNPKFMETHPMFMDWKIHTHTHTHTHTYIYTYRTIE